VISSSQRPLPDNTQHSQQTNIHAPGGIGTQNLNRQAAADLRLRPRGHWDRQNYGVDEGENIKGVRGLCVPTGGGVSKTYSLSSVGDSEGGDGAVGCRCSSERMGNDTYGIPNAR